MKNYSVKENLLIENTTGHVLLKGGKEKLKTLSKRLNGGHGFNGFTPLFFCLDRITAPE